MLSHLGGMKPGERKPVPPWPDKIDDRRVQQAVEAWAQKRSWRPGRYSHEIVGTDPDGSIAVTVYRTDGEPARNPSERPNQWPFACTRETTPS